MAKIKLERVIAQISAVDLVVALDLNALAEGLARYEERITAAASQAAAPGKIALVGVYGALTPRGSYYGSSLAGIAGQVARAAADPDVAGIVLDVDSPGGTVSGTAEAAGAVAAAAKQKPCIACVNTLAASAAYWIASQTSQVVMSPSADVGSIGAMMMHVDYGKALADAGINVTLIRSEQSPMKNEAHPFGPLTDEARAFIQQRLNGAGADFIKAVADGRGVSQAKVREEYGQGRVFGSREAVARGMADGVMTLSDAVGSMIQKAARTSSRRRSALAFE